MNDDIRGKRVLITGAAGIHGRWFATAFARAGARLLLSDNRAEALEQTLSDLGLDPAATMTHATELLDDTSVADLAAMMEREWGAPDIVLNNAGIYPGKPLLETEAADHDAMFGINCRAPFLIARDAARLMVAAGVRGNIVNIGSGAARKMRPSRVLYCTSKTTLERLTKGFALELAPHGIRVNLVEPGFAAGSEVSPLSEEHVRTTVAGIPLGRVAAPEDAAEAVLSVEGGNSIRA